MILIPLIWTALFHRVWESACVVVAIVAVEVVLSLTPVAAGDPVIARRVILWASLGAVISIATHGLRDRIRRSHGKRLSCRTGCVSSPCWRTGTGSPPTCRTRWFSGSSRPGWTSRARLR